MTIKSPSLGRTILNYIPVLLVTGLRTPHGLQLLCSL